MRLYRFLLPFCGATNNLIPSFTVQTSIFRLRCSVTSFPLFPALPSMPALLVFALLLAVAFWLHRIYLAFRRFLQFWEIRTFYHHALDVSTVSVYLLSLSYKHSHFVYVETLVSLGYREVK